MNKLDQFRFGNTHKRSMRILGISTVALFAIALMLLAIIGVFGSRSNNVRIVLYEQNSGLVMDGAGLNLTDIPSSNRISDYDFENALNSHSFTVSGADNSYLYFESDAGVNSSIANNGDIVDVYSLDSNGVMSLKFSGTVSGVNQSRFGMNNLIEDPSGLWINDPITKTAVSDGVIDAITLSGKLIFDISGEYGVFSSESNGENFVDICSSGSTVYALSDRGSVYMSQDGRSFSLLMELDLDETSTNDIAVAGSSLILISSDGDCWNISNGRSTKLPLTINSDKYTVVSDGSRVLICDGDRILISSNCYYFAECIEGENLLHNLNIISSASGNNSIYLLNSAGELLSIDGEGYSEVTDISSISPKMVACTDEGNVIVLSGDNNAFLLATNGEMTNLTNGSYSVDGIFQGVNGRMIARSSRNLYMDRVLTGLQILESVPEGSVMSGDICMISSASSSISNSWEMYGDNTQMSTTSLSGNRCMVLSGTSDGVHAVSTRLYGSSADNFSENSFYRMELFIKGEVGSTVKIWLYGDNMEEGFEAEITSDKFEKYSYVFAVTENMISESDTVRFNIAIEGASQIYIDDVYLGEDKYEIGDIPSEFSSAIVASQPAAMRLPYLNVGGNGFSEDHFYGLYPDSLESSLRLVRDSGSCPWFVIGSDVKASDINNLLSYLCGSVSSEYGKLRTDNGTALPWNRQFDRIYIEIGDDIGAYCSDVQRGAYVSYVIGLFRQSDSYVDVRDKIVFLDGMNYDGSTVLSVADYHTTALNIDLSQESMEDLNYLGRLDSIFTDFNYDVPRITSHAAGGGEFISSLSIDSANQNSMNAGRMISVYLNENAEYIKMCMFDVDVSDRPVDTESIAVIGNESTRMALNMIGNLSFMNNTQGIYFEVADPMDSSADDSAELFLQSCTVQYVADHDNKYLIVANTSDFQQQFITEGVDFIANDSTIIRYSANGEVLFDRTVKRIDLRYTLQPGEVIVFTIPNV